MAATVTETGNRTGPPENALRAQPGPQEAFLASTADLVFYGGAAFGGKSYALLLDQARWTDRPNYRGVLFRRTRPQLTQLGGLWDESQNIYPQLGAMPASGPLLWKWPSGAIISMRSAQHAAQTAQDYKGLQADVLSFDQVEEFEERQVFYLMSRNRGSAGIRSYTRGTFNPQPGWLTKFLEWWWDPISGYAIPERAGVVRWYSRVNDQVYWADRPEPLVEKFGHLGADYRPMSCTFIPAKVADNKLGLAKNPGYVSQLMNLRNVDTERLLKGNFKIGDFEGAEWPPEYFEDIYTDTWPDAFDVKVIYIDPSKGRNKSDDPSAIVFVGLFNGKLYVDADIRVRPTPEIVEDTATFASNYLPDEVTFEDVLFQDLLALDFERYCKGIGYFPWPIGLLATGGIDKNVRIKRLGGYFRGGRIKLRRTQGAEVLLDQLRVFGMKGVKDDGPDALEGGVRRLQQIIAKMMAQEPEERWQ